MNRRNIIITYPTSSVRNNLNQHREFEQGRAMIPYSTVYYSEVLASKLRELRELQEKVNKIDKRLSALEKKIVTAPLREDAIFNDAKKRREAIVAIRTAPTHHIPTSSLTAQNYIKAKQAYTRNMNQNIIKPNIPTVVLPVETKTEKPSFWQKIKKAVKGFFGVDTQAPKENTQLNYSNNSKNNNQKYNQFRESIPKKTIEIKVQTSNKPKAKPTEHIFDEYA